MVPCGQGTGATCCAGELQLCEEGAPGSEFESVLLWETLQGWGLHIRYWPSLASVARGLRETCHCRSLRSLCCLTAFQLLLSPWWVSGTEAERREEYNPEPNWRREKGVTESWQGEVEGVRVRAGTEVMSPTVHREQPRWEWGPLDLIRSWSGTGSWGNWSETGYKVDMTPHPRLGEPTWASGSAGLCPLLLRAEVDHLATILPSSLVVSALAWAPAPARQAFPPGGTLQVPFSPKSSVMTLIDASFQQTLISRPSLPGTMLGMEGTVMNLPPILLSERKWGDAEKTYILTTQPLRPHLFYPPVLPPYDLFPVWSVSEACGTSIPCASPHVL